MRRHTNSHGAHQIDIQHLREDVQVKFLVATDDACSVHDHVQLRNASYELIDGGSVGDIQDFVRTNSGRLSFEASPTEITFALASEKDRAMALPIPLVPPVTSTHFPLKSNMSYIMRNSEWDEHSGTRE